MILLLPATHVLINDLPRLVPARNYGAGQRAEKAMGSDAMMLDRASLFGLISHHPPPPILFFQKVSMAWIRQKAEAGRQQRAKQG